MDVSAAIDDENSLYLGFAGYGMWAVTAGIM